MSRFNEAHIDSYYSYTANAALSTIVSQIYLAIRRNSRNTQPVFNVPVRGDPVKISQKNV